MCYFMNNRILLFEECTCRELWTGSQRVFHYLSGICSTDCPCSFYGVGHIGIINYLWILLRIVYDVLEHQFFILHSVTFIKDFNLSLSFLENRLILFSLILYLKCELCSIQSLKLFMICRFLIIHIVNNVFPLFCRKLIKPFSTFIVDIWWPSFWSSPKFIFLHVDHLDIFLFLPVFTILMVYGVEFIQTTFLLILTFIIFVSNSSYILFIIKWVLNGPHLDIFFWNGSCLDRTFSI